MVFVGNSIIAKNLESLEGKESETICIEVTISKKSGVLHLFTDRHKMTTK